MVNSKKNPYLAHIKKYWNNDIPHDRSIILCDASEDPAFIITSNYFHQILKIANNSRVYTFSNNKKTNLGILRKALGFNGHVETKLQSREMLKKLKNIVNDSQSKLKTKKDIFNFKLNDIWIGIDIYETYLKLGYPTINIKDKSFGKCYRGC